MAGCGRGRHEGGGGDWHGDSAENGRVTSGGGGREPGRPGAAVPGWALAGGVALALVIGALALRAAAGAALHTPRVGYGVAAIVALAVFAAGVATVAYYRRRTPGRAYRGAAGERLHQATLAVLVTLTLAVPAALLIFDRLDLHGSGSPNPPVNPAQPSSGPSPAIAPATGPARPATHWHLNLMPLLIALTVLGVALVLGAVVYFLYKLLRGPLAGAIEGGEPAAGQDEARQEEQDALADALLAGRSALAGDDARAAIIACYAAMERSLAAAGIARLAADSPTDLLRRAVQRGAVDPAGSARLTDLFREARYSTHPMGAGQLAEARAALDAVTAALAAATATAAAAGQATPRDATPSSPATGFTGGASERGRAVR